MKKFNKFWWIGMGLIAGTMLVLLAGLLSMALTYGKTRETGFIIAVSSVLFLIPGVILWIYGAKDKLKKNPKLPKASFITWIVSSGIIGICLIFVTMGITIKIDGNGDGILVVVGAILGVICALLFMIFLTIWLITRTKKPHSTNTSNTQTA